MPAGRCWLWLSLVLCAGTVFGAVLMRALRIDAGRIGSYFGILIIGTAFLALLSGIASRVGWRRASASAAAVIAIGGAAEILSLYTGLPFGRYEYTDWWLPYVRLPQGKVYPLLLAPTWFLVVASCYLVAARRLRGWALLFGTALMAALLDLVAEPVLTRVVLFWRWLEPTPLFGAPYLNPVGWFVTASLAAGCLHLLGIRRARALPHATWMLTAGLVLTPVLGLVHGEPRGALALALLPLVLWCGRAD